MLTALALVSMWWTAAPPAEGDVVQVKVTTVAEYGCFVVHKDGWEALLHVSDLAWERVEDPKRYCKRGRTLTVKVLHAGERISVSRKAVQPDPWVGAEKRYPVGKKLRARVIILAMDEGLLLELAPGVDASLYKAGLPANLTEWPRVGKKVEVVVAEVSEADRFIRVVLAHPPPSAPPSRAEVLDALRTDLLPNLIASLAVLEPMAQAGKIDEAERALAARMAGLVSERVQGLCSPAGAGSGAGPSAADCAAARAHAKAIEGALVAPSVPGLAQAERDCAALRTLSSSW